MNRKLIMTIALMLGIYTWSMAQSHTIKGRVTDKDSHQALKDVQIKFPKLNKVCITDLNGRFVITIPEGIHRMQVSYVGYQPQEYMINPLKENNLSIELNTEVTALSEIEVAGSIFKRSGESTARLDVPLKDIPVTVTSLDKELIEQRQVSSINEALRYTTGVKPTVNYGGFQTFKLRGLGRPVIMVDGARDERMNFSNSAPVTSLAAVDRIEYLKGPASVLYGHSADGGIINIVRKQPTQNFTANFSGYYGSWRNRGATIGAGGKLSDKANYRFDASIGNQKGWRDSEQKIANAYLATDYNIDRNNKLELRFGANDDFYATETGFPVFSDSIFETDSHNLVYTKGDWVKEFDRKQRYNDPQDFLKHKNINGAAKYTHQFANQSKIALHSSYSYDFIDYFATESLSFPTADSAMYGHYFMRNGQKKYIDLAHITRSYPLRFAHETKTYQNYLDYSINFNTGDIKHHLLAGYFLMVLDRVSFTGYNDDDIYGPAKYATVAIQNPILNQGFIGEKFSGGHVYHEFVNGIYAQDLLEFSPKFKALAALRIDRYQMDYQYAKVQTGKELSEYTEKSTIVNIPLSYRLGVVYEPVENVSLYASYSNFFRPKRSTFRKNYIYIDKAGKRFYPKDGKEVFKPETGYQAEVGVRYKTNTKLQLNASVYYINKENIVEYLGKVTEDSIEKRVYGQVGLVDSKGFELDVVYAPVRALNITTGYTYCEAKYKNFATNDYVTNNSNEGNFLRRNPKNQFFMWTYYQVPTGTFKRFNIGLGISYTDVMYTNASNQYELPSYWLTEAAVGYGFGNMYMKFKINNIFNTEYISNNVFSNQYIPGEERNFLLSIGYKL